jgi:site-specific recombinase XerD
MAERSKRICLYDKEKAKQINPETLKLFQKYQIDMSIRDLSKNSIYGYNTDLMQWFIYMYDNQFNLSVLEATDDDLNEYFYFRKQEGNNTARQRRVMSSISAFYKFLRKKKLITETPTEFLERPKLGQSVVKQTFLTVEQVEQLRQKLSEYGDIQLQAYIFFGLSTMGRVNAMAHLKWEQIDFDERTCFDVLEKEGKIVDLYFSEEVEGLLKK